MYHKAGFGASAAMVSQPLGTSVNIRAMRCLSGNAGEPHVLAELFDGAFPVRLQVAHYSLHAGRLTGISAGTKQKGQGLAPDSIPGRPKELDALLLFPRSSRHWSDREIVLFFPP